MITPPISYVPGCFRVVPYSCRAPIYTVLYRFLFTGGKTNICNDVTHARRGVVWIYARTLYNNSSYCVLLYALVAKKLQSSPWSQNRPQELWGTKVPRKEVSNAHQTIFGPVE